ncbi:hypothetical protein GCM10028857_20160 [Salinarchaeum chitinilyticum]
MEHVITAGRFAVWLLAIGTSVALGAYLFGRRDRAAARPLLGVAVVLSIGALAHALVAGPSPADDALARIGLEPADDWWVVQGATVTILASGSWTLFAFAYTGRSHASIRGLRAGVTLLGIGAALLTVRAAVRGSSQAIVDGLAVLLLLAALSAAVGVCLLLWTSGGRNAFPTVEPLLLAGGVVVFLPGVFLAQLSGAPWLFPATIAIASGAFLAAVGRYPTFDTLPAARVAGRDRVVDELSTGVLVVDRRGRIQDCNARAESLFDVRAETVTGDPLADLLGVEVAPEALAEAGEPTELVLDRGTVVELTGSPITGTGDRSFGTLLLCEDVTQRRRREERLSILRQFVVDVVGDRMEHVATSAAAAQRDEADERPDSAGAEADPGEGLERDDRTTGSGGHDLADRAEDVWTTTTALTTLVSNARDVERAIARSEAPDGSHAGKTDLGNRIETVVASVSEGTDSSPTVELPDAPFRTAVPIPLFETLLRTVLEETSRLAQGPVTITATAASDPTIHLRFDRPAEEGSDGVSGDDRSLPVTRLAVDHAGGILRVEGQTDEQCCVTIELPPPAADGDRLAASPPGRFDRVREKSAGAAGPSTTVPHPPDVAGEDGR